MANNDLDNAMQEKNDSIRVGIDYAVKLSFSAIDNSSLDFDTKRNLLFSVYSFRCLFDNSEMMYINPILRKYKCTFSCPLQSHPLYNEHKEEFDTIEKTKEVYIPYGGLYVFDDDNYVVRYDAGSPVWQMFSDSQKLASDEMTLPAKYELYDMVYEIINLSSADDELRAMWYLTFPYVMLIGAPHDVDTYEILFDELTKEQYFEIVINTTYSLYIKDSLAELESEQVPSNIISWYEPYMTYKLDKDKNGITNEVKRFQKWLSQGMFSLVFAGTEKLLNTCPDDDSLLLCNIASRISLKNIESDDERINLLKETLEIINAILERPTDKKVLFVYYSALVYLGLKNPESALEKFKDCLEIDSNFDPAKVMISALTKENNNAKS